MALPIFVVNMASSLDRREHMTRMMSQLGVDFEFFPATDGRQLTEEQFKSCSLQPEVVLPLRFGLKTIVENPLTPSEIGCALSHLRLYQHILDQGLEEAVIMEDDINLYPPALLALDNLDCIREAWDVVDFSLHLGLKNLYLAHKYRFGPHNEFYFQRAGLQCPLLNVFLNRRRVVGTTIFYVIKRSGCQRLLELGYPVRIPADYLLGYLAYNELKMFRAYPVDKFFAEAGGLDSTLSMLGRKWHEMRRI